MNESDSITRNREGWGREAPEYVAAGEVAWANEPYWGIWQLPEAQLRLLPEDMTGRDALEVGCGTGYVSAWLERRGASAVGIDPTPEQLATASRLRDEHVASVKFVEGSGEHLPFADDSFDFAISEYGAVLWADPYEWIPECARVLRSGAQLVALTNSPLVVMCSQEYENSAPISADLKRPYFGMGRTTWPDDDRVEFHLTHSEWISLFVANRFRVERLLELQAPAGAETCFAFVDAGWASQWPAEEAWVVRLG